MSTSKTHPRVGGRFFIGPLTQEQQRRREPSRERWRVIEEIMYVRNLTFKEAFEVWKDHQNPRYIWSNATGEYP